MSPDIRSIRLYHYLESKWALDDLARKRLKLCRIADLNDPYEWACVYSTDAASQLVLENSRLQEVERHGLISFCRDWSNILLWSHYAQKHQGMCLGFDIPIDLTRAVNYAAKVHVVGDLTAMPLKNKAAILRQLNWTKYKDWSYEKEYRAWGSRREVDPETGLFYVPFNEKLVLREVFIGERCEVSRQQIKDALAGHEDVPIQKVRHDPARFKMVVDTSL